MEFDANQLLGPPYHCAPDAISGDQKCKLRRDADRADYLKRRSSRGLVTNETGDCAPAELDASGLHEAPPWSRSAQAKLGGGQSARLAVKLDLFRSAATKLAR